MQVTFGNCFDDKRTVNKNFHVEINRQCEIYDNCSITNPVLLVDTFLSYNYCYIANWGRYYYIVDRVVMPNGRMQVKLHCDVLKSFATGIYNLSCNIVRQENAGVNYIVDNFLPIASEKEIKVIPFTNNVLNIGSASSSNYNFVLNVAGGGSNGG